MFICGVSGFRDDDLTPSRTELLSRTLLMRLFGLQMPIRMSRKTERAFRQLERISDGLQEQVTCHPPVHEGTHLEYVKGRTVVSPGVVERSVAEMNSIALKQKQTELNQGQVHERLQPRSAEELKHSRLSLEDQVGSVSSQNSSCYLIFVSVSFPRISVSFFTYNT